jgi:serine/threonine protein kinase
VLSDVAKTLKLIAERGFVHGDIKMENILLSEGGKPRGFTNDFDMFRRRGDAGAGTLAYQDALTAEGYGQVSVFSDAYALALTAGEALFGYDVLSASRQGLRNAAEARMLQLIGEEFSQGDTFANVYTKLEQAARSEVSARQQWASDMKSLMDKLIKHRDKIDTVLAANERITEMLKNTGSELEPAVEQLRKEIWDMKSERFDRIEAAARRLDVQFPEFSAFRDSLAGSV